MRSSAPQLTGKPFSVLRRVRDEVALSRHDDHRQGQIAIAANQCDRSRHHHCAFGGRSALLCRAQSQAPGKSVILSDTDARAKLNFSAAGPVAIPRSGDIVIATRSPGTGRTESEARSGSCSTGRPREFASLPRSPPGTRGTDVGAGRLSRPAPATSVSVGCSDRGCQKLRLDRRRPIVPGCRS